MGIVCVFSTSNVKKNVLIIKIVAQYLYFRDQPEIEISSSRMLFEEGNDTELVNVSFLDLKFCLKYSRH